jgi:hypothetical protein
VILAKYILQFTTLCQLLETTLEQNVYTLSALMVVFNDSNLKGLDQRRHHLTALCSVEVNYFLSNDGNVCGMVRFGQVTMRKRKGNVLSPVIPNFS